MPGARQVLEHRDGEHNALLRKHSVVGKYKSITSTR